MIQEVWSKYKYSMFTAQIAITGKTDNGERTCGYAISRSERKKPRSIIGGVDMFDFQASSLMRKRRGLNDCFFGKDHCAVSTMRPCPTIMQKVVPDSVIVHENRPGEH